MINLINKLLFLLHLPLITYYSPYSREERNKIYKEALHIWHIKEYPGFCMLFDVLGNYEIGNFPELLISKPIWWKLFWYKPYLKEPRIKALEKAIKLTE